MLIAETLTRLFVDEMRADAWCRDIIRIHADDTSKAADRLQNWYLYFHDGGTIGEKIIQLVIPQLDWPAMVQAVKKDQQGAAMWRRTGRQELAENVHIK